MRFREKGSYLISHLRFFLVLVSPRLGLSIGIIQTLVCIILVVIIIVVTFLADLGWEELQALDQRSA